MEDDMVARLTQIILVPYSHDGYSTSNSPSLARENGYGCLSPIS